jgi:hypothetical protein
LPGRTVDVLRAEIPALNKKGRRNTVSATSLSFDIFVIQFQKKIVKRIRTFLKNFLKQVVGLQALGEGVADKQQSGENWHCLQ